METWWESHSINPDSASYWGGALPTPDPVINVADVRANNPGTTTAGIAEALDMLPAEGGTLYFPASESPYEVTKASTRIYNYYYVDGAIHVLRKKNIHFVSDGATIRHSDYLFGFSSMEYSDTLGSPTGSLKSNPSRGFSFRGLTFDGSNSIHQAFLFRHCGDIVFQNCRFENYAPNPRHPEPGAEHHGPVNATSMTDNFWMIDCEIETGGLAAYVDGVHNGGFVNCTFDVGDNRDAIMMFTNNDMWEWSAEQRSTQYVAIVGNEFVGSGRTGVQMTAANVLVKDNVQSGGLYNSLVRQTGRGPSNLQRHLYYNGSGIRIKDNTVENVIEFAVFLTDISQHTRLGQIEAQNVVQGNQITSARTFIRALASPLLSSPIEEIYASDNEVESNLRAALKLEPDVDAIRNVTLENNIFHGTDLPQTAVLDQPVENVLITRNDFFGNERDLLDNQSGSALPDGAVSFSFNRINPVGVGEPFITPEGGFFWDSVSASLSGESGDSIFYSLDGSDPQVGGLAYAGPILLTQPTTLSARAQDAGGEWSRLVMADFTIGDTSQAPEAPSSPSARIVEGGIELSWTPEARDPEAYQIERSVEGLHYSVIASVNAPTADYTDASADPEDELLLSGPDGAIWFGFRAQPRRLCRRSAGRALQCGRLGWARYRKSRSGRESFRERWNCQHDGRRCGRLGFCGRGLLRSGRSQW